MICINIEFVYIVALHKTFSQWNICVIINYQVWSKCYIVQDIVKFSYFGLCNIARYDILLNILTCRWWTRYCWWFLMCHSLLFVLLHFVVLLLFAIGVVLFVEMRTIKVNVTCVTLCSQITLKNMIKEINSYKTITNRTLDNALITQILIDK
jgi:hypothetical protein